MPLDRHFDNGFMKKLTNGWQFNGIATFQGGQPFTLYSDNDSSQQGNGLDRPDIIGPIQYLNPRSTTTSFDSSTASCLAGASDGQLLVQS